MARLTKDEIREKHREKILHILKLQKDDQARAVQIADYIMNTVSRVVRRERTKNLKVEEPGRWVNDCKGWQKKNH